jgi:hypothetical protein
MPGAPVTSSSIYIKYVVYNNNTTMAVPEPTPNSDPHIWDSKPKIFQCPEDDPGGRMMLGRRSTSTQVILCCVIMNLRMARIISSRFSLPSNTTTTVDACIPHQSFFPHPNPPVIPALTARAPQRPLALLL